MKTIGAAAILILAAGGAHAKDTQFWNLTSHAITELRLSPAGKSDWGPDQTVNDADHAVEHDERLKITGIATGVYDVKFTDKSGRNCVVAGVMVRQGAVFSIDEKKLKDCR